MHTEGSSRGQNAQKMDLGLNEHAEIEIKASLLAKLILSLSLSLSLSLVVIDHK